MVSVSFHLESKDSLVVSQQESDVPIVETQKYFFDADQQYHYVHLTSHVQSAAFDRIVNVAVRPAPVILATPLFHRLAKEKHQTSFPDHQKYNLGDVLNVSNLPEYVLYLIVVTEGRVLEKYFSDQGVNTDGWEGLLRSFQPQDWQKLCDYILDDLKQHPENFNLPRRAQGNHDGAYDGNWLRHDTTPWHLKMAILQTEHQFQQLETKIQRAEKRDSTRPYYLQRLQQEKRELANLLMRYEEELAVLEAESHDDSFLQKGLKIPTHLINIVFGIGQAKLRRSRLTVWEQNAGHPHNVFSKTDYLQTYLQEKFPEVHLTPSSLRPFATEVSFESGFFDLFDKPYSLAVAKKDDNNEFIADKNGLYHMQEVQIDAPPSQQDLFPLLWQEVRPNEWVCLIQLNNRHTHQPENRYVFLQAFAENDLNGRKLFHFVLDGMDYTQEKVQLAFWGGLSKLQRQALQVFIDQQRLIHDKNVLFTHSSHFALNDVSHVFWRRFGWDDYFSQPDVLPFIFVGHGHKRQIHDESKKYFLGRENSLLGKRLVSRDDGFYSMMVPSTTDFPNEFMAVELIAQQQSLELKQEYHPVLSIHDLKQMDKEVLRLFGYTFFGDSVMVFHQMGHEKIKKWCEAYSYRKYSEQQGVLRGYLSLLKSADYLLATDAIPLAIGQFHDIIEITEFYLYFLQKDFSENDPFVKRVQEILQQLKEQEHHFLYGDPTAINVYDQMGWIEAKKQAENEKNRHKKWELLSHYNDVFASSAFDLLMIQVALTPENSAAFDFLVLLGYKSSLEEGWHDNAVVPQSQSYQIDL